MKLIVFFACVTLISSTVFFEISGENLKKPKILITILVRNKAHTLPYFLSYLEQLIYPKERIHLWIYSDNNFDDSIQILTLWLNNEGRKYHGVEANFDLESSGFEDEKGIAHWSPQRTLHVINLREKALNAGRNIWADFIWSNGLYSNFWAGMTDNFYYLRTEMYKPILFRETVGCLKVPMIHSAVLIDLRKHVSDNLTYDPRNINKHNCPTDDIITFAISANNSDIPLFICNDIYGYIMVPLEEEETITEDLQRLTNIKIEILSDNNNNLPLSTHLEQFVQYPTQDRLQVDKVYMINLLRRPEKRNRMNKIFKELGISTRTIDAIDGSKLSPADLKIMQMEIMPEYVDPYHNRPMTMGEVGCFLSHYIVWNKMVENNFSNIIVLEDDVRFEPFFNQKVNYILKELEDLQLEWDLIYLGRKKLTNNTEPSINGSKYLVQASYSYWTIGYILSASGAKKLIDAMPLKRLIPVDEYLPMLSDVHPRDDWKIHYPNRNLIILSAHPLLIYPMHYIGEEGYVSDTENSTLASHNEGIDELEREDL
ncbi:Glycosyltransferase 25 family member [Melipona quadrifasciata]|uniref:Glycosyltransferase 25 family member n=1 Tax=Melipona quadrifasciata TaxID=166423 RepID=A0A0M9A877_9HYME|nr:Glycosyltransferase 25 family member [Melipona quadrifasciata]